MSSSISRGQAFDQLGFVVDADIKPMDAALGALSSSITKFSAGAFTKLSGAIGVGFTASALYGSVKSAMKFAGDLVDTAEGLGVTTTALQTLNYAAERSGAGMQRLELGLNNIVNAQSAVAKGNRDLVKTFEQLGISEIQVRTESPADIIDLIGQKLFTSTDYAKDYAATLELIGSKGAPKLVAAFKDIAAAGGIEAQSRVLQDTGRILQEDFAKRLDAAQKVLKDAENRMKVWWAGVVSFYAPNSIEQKTREEKLAVARDQILKEQYGEKRLERGFRPREDLIPLIEREAYRRVVEDETKKKEQERKDKITQAEADVKAAQEIEDAKLKIEKDRKREESKAYAERTMERESRVLDAAEEEQAKVLKEELKIKVEREDIMAGRNVSVRGPEPADRFARLGGYIGGQTDPMRSYWDKQLQITMQMRDYLRDIASNKQVEDLY